MIAVQIAGGDMHTCAIRTGGTVYCWGRNSSGQVGQTAGAPVLVPASVPGLTGVVQLGGGDGYTCALREDKMVLCWGFNNSGQLGDGTTGSHAIPTLVSGWMTWRRLPWGGHTPVPARQAAWFGAGEVVLPGSSETAPWPSPTHPVLVTGLTDAMQVVAGHLHSCALSKDRAGVFCWGDNNVGQLGVGATPDSSNVPMRVPDLFEVSSLAGGSEHNCARHTGTVVSCWGAQRLEPAR